MGVDINSDGLLRMKFVYHKEKLEYFISLFVIRIILLDIIDISEKKKF